MNWEMVSALVGAVAVFGGWIGWSVHQMRQNDLLHITSQLQILSQMMQELKVQFNDHLTWHLDHHD